MRTLPSHKNNRPDTGGKDGGDGTADIRAGGSQSQFQCHSSNNINDPESSPIRIGDNAVVKIDANIGNAAIS